MSGLEQLIRFAFDSIAESKGIPVLPHEQFENVRSALALSPNDFFDHFARHIAHGYDAETLNFEIADCAMNSLSAYCLSHYDVQLPCYAHEVFLAFDDGEFMHQGENETVDAEAKYTRPQIRSLVIRDRILGA